MTIDLYTLLRWSLAAITVFIFYRLIVRKFANKMLELPTEKNDETLEKVLYFEDDVEEEKKDNKNLLKKVEDSLKLSESQEEAKLRYEILRDRLKEMVEKSPKESAQLFTDLVKDKE